MTGFADAGHYHSPFASQDQFAGFSKAGINVLA
jgi:hypothetical protein